jgi:hypothetical protein
MMYLITHRLYIIGVSNRCGGLTQAGWIADTVEELAYAHTDATSNIKAWVWHASINNTYLGQKSVCKDAALGP